MMARTIPKKFKDIAVRTESSRRFQSALIFLAMQADDIPQEAGFMKLGGFDHIDKKTEREFADLARQQKKERQKTWQKESGCNDRWSVKIAFSAFKRIFGECIVLDKMIQTLWMYVHI